MSHFLLSESQAYGRPPPPLLLPALHTPESFTHAVPQQGTATVADNTGNQHLVAGQVTDSSVMAEAYDESDGMGKVPGVSDIGQRPRSSDSLMSRSLSSSNDSNPPSLSPQGLSAASKHDPEKVQTSDVILMPGEAKGVLNIPQSPGILYRSPITPIFEKGSFTKPSPVQQNKDVPKSFGSPVGAAKVRPDQPVADLKDHNKVLNDNHKQKLCALCQFNKVRTKRGWVVLTQFKCEKCDLPLCIGERNCFVKYHALVQSGNMHPLTKSRSYPIKKD